jgi:LmbE family N-acetylglucosaminyl deacetylase
MLAVVSPHLDDAAFSVGGLIAAHPGSVVVTVFAGDAPDPGQRTEWDTACGFSHAAQAMSRRRDEDHRALAALEARPVWLRFVDSQYGGEAATPREIAGALQEALQSLAPDTVLLPLGLFHGDHRRVHDASIDAVQTLRMPWLAYEDALYRGLTGLLQQRLMELAQAGWQATPARFGAPHAEAAAKARAVARYASQLRGFGAQGHDDLAWPERCWRLEPTPTTPGS